MVVESGSAITEQVETCSLDQDHHLSHPTPGSEVKLHEERKRGEDILELLAKSGTSTTSSSFPTSPLLLTSPNQTSSSSNLVVPALIKQRQKQEEKKKLIWGDAAQQKVRKNIFQETSLILSSHSQVKSPWEGLKFSSDSQTEKFRKLMGIKGTASGGDNAGSGDNVGSEDNLDKKQEKIFQDLQDQYSIARLATHSQARGAGLGSFGSRH